MQVRAIFAVPRMKFHGVVVRVVHHVAVAHAVCRVTNPIGIGSVVQANLTITYFTKVSWVTHAACNRKLHRTISIEGAVVLAVLDAAVVSNVWRVAVRSPKAVAYAVDLVERIRASRASNLGNILDVSVVVLMLVPRLAAMHTHLLIRILVIIARGAWARSVGAINAVITRVTNAVVIETIASKRAVVDAVTEAEQPHVVLHDRCVRLDQ